MTQPVNKSALRTMLKTTRNAFRQSCSSHEWKRLEEVFAESLLSLPQIIHASTVHCYCAFGSEVPTERIIDYLFQSGKRVIVPVTPMHNSELHYAELQHVEITSQTLFTPDKRGIPTPIPSEHAPKLHFCKPTEILTVADCVLVPMLGFDDNGGRLGYGKGFYDRFIGSLDVFKLGMAFACQRVPVVPCEAHDVRMDAILTEEGLVMVRNNN